MRRSGPESLLVIGVVLLSGCGEHRKDRGLAWQFIETPPRFIIAPSDLMDVECARRFSFPEGVDSPEAMLVEGERISDLGAGLTVRGGSTAPRLRIPRPLDPAVVDSARLTVGGLRRGQVRMRWRTVDNSASGEASLPKSAGTGALRDHFLLDLADAASRGLPFVVEIEPTSAAGEIVTLGEVCLGKRVGSATRLAAAAAVPWKVTLDDETRDVLLFPTNGVLARDGVLPARSRLELGVGLVSGSVDGVEVVAELVRDGRRIPFGSALVAGDRLASGWSDLSFDLPSLAPGPVRVEVSARPQGGRHTAVLAASSPRILDLESSDPRPNIVLISLDTLAADHMSLYGYPRSTSPNIDRWAAKNGAIFERAVTPASWTLPAHFSLFTGVEAFAHPANYNSIAFDASAYRFLAEELRAVGYRTIAITGGSFVAPDYGLARGFESFRAWRSKELRDAELEAHLERVKSFLEVDHAQPFFLFFHTYEVHTPNGPREPWFSAFHGRPEVRVVDLGPPDPPRPEDGFLGSGHFVLRKRNDDAAERVGPGTQQLPTDAYDSAIAYLDDRIAPMLDRLTAGELGSRTVVALVSDHGESLGEGGRAGHTFLSWDNLHVPMVLVGPAHLVPRQRIRDQVRLHDLHPTLLGLAGLPPVPGSDGRSLEPLLRGTSDPGRLAFAYAAPTNRGLAVISPDGLKLEWNNSAWRPLTGRLHWARVEGAREMEIPGSPSRSEEERLRRLLEAGYSTQAPGLRVEVGSDSSVPVSFELDSDSIDPVSVKATSIAGSGLHWADVGRLRGELVAGQALQLNFERTARREISLAIRVSDPRCGNSASATVRGTAERLRTEHREELRPTGCPEGVSSTTRLKVQWKGPVPDSEWTPQDEQLKDELKALGYLN